jgi:hypothetical protein
MEAPISREVGDIRTTLLVGWHHLPTSRIRGHKRYIG